MTEGQSHGIPIFWQTLAMLIGYLLSVYLVTWMLALTQLREEPEVVGMTEIAGMLSDSAATNAMLGVRPSRLGRMETMAAPPAIPKGMIDDHALAADLAGRLRTRGGNVRLYFPPNRRQFLPFERTGQNDSVPRWRGEALFFDGAVAARREKGGWRVLTLPGPSRTIWWERRAELIPAVLGLLLVGMAFLFARGLSRPLRRFATNADRLGRRHSAIPVPIEGPAELRTAAQAVNAMQQRIEDMIRERTELVAVIAHDLRTPLARIAFRVETSRDEVREPVLEDIEQMREMIAETLDFARGAVRSKDLEPCDLVDLAEEIARVQREIGQDVSIAAAAPCFVCGDRLALKRMLQNLIENAIKFGDEAQVVIHQHGTDAVIDVLDRGPGLPEVMLERVLAPFVRNEPSRSRETGGAGLGLAIAKSIANEHGGTISLANRSGGGLIASISLPLLAEHG